MKFSKHTVFILVLLLITLNIIFRYPTTPHEIGWDSFEIHCMANSVSEFGLAKWWIHPASIFGFYPYSYASTVPFILSGISQCAGVDMEWVIWLFCVLIGIFSAFTAYLMAGAIKDDDIFKYLVAFAYSTSTGILYFTTWTVSTRGLFIVLLPLFIYLLLKCRISIFKYGTLTSILFVALLTTHHLFYFIAPVVIAYLVVTIFYKLKNHIKFDKIPKKFVYFTLPICFLGMFVIPFFTRGLIKTGSRYGWLLETQLPEYARMIGLLGIFIVGGLSYLMFKHNKSFEEWFLVIALLGLTPLLYVGKYTKWVFLSFAFLLIGVALTNIAKIKIRTEKKKYSTFIVIILLLLSISFTGYYQYLHFLNNPNPNKRYMEEGTYIGALWIKDNINKDKNIFSESYISLRVFSTSEVPTFTGSGVPDMAYGFVNPNKLEITQIHSPLSVNFYLHEPYRPNISTSWRDWKIRTSAIDDPWARRLIPEYNLSYYVDNEDISNALSRSLQQAKNDVYYDNGKIHIWQLN